MIPKIIHYCWFGRNPLPELSQRCIASWKKYLPDYEIKEWNEDNFDVNIIPYTAEAYAAKKYAFVSDYARFWILNKYGGIYFDTDVEVIRSFDDIVKNGNFMGFEVDPNGENSPEKYAPRYAFCVNPGLGIGMEKGHPFLHKMLGYYADLHFVNKTLNPWFETIVAHTTRYLVKEGLQNKKGIQRVDDITIYPQAYFAPINVISERLHLTPQTYSIHQYMGSWNKEGNTLKNLIRHLVPECLFFLNNKLKRRIYRRK